MVLIIGGFAQGKLEYAKKNFNVKEYSDGRIGSENCIYNLQNAVNAPDFDAKLQDYIESRPDCVIICNETGGGIVPTDEEERVIREKTGRTLCMLAERADSVHRVLCGLGMVIK